MPRQRGKPLRIRQAIKPFIAYGLAVPIWGQDPELQAARQEAEDALPTGWRLRGTDREGFQWHGEPYAILRAWAALAESDHGERVAAVATSETDAYRELASRLRGETEESAGWAPPAGAVEPE